MPAGLKIQLMFWLFDLEETSTCQYDFVEVNSLFLNCSTFFHLY